MPHSCLTDSWNCPLCFAENKQHISFSTITNCSTCSNALSWSGEKVITYEEWLIYDSSNKGNSPILIENWDQLADCKSDTHSLFVDTDCGFGRIYLNDEFKYYLSTHTFYQSQFESSTKILQQCGFNVVLKSWG